LTVPEDRGPFQGLGFYTEADAKWFFGRATERKIILAHLRTAPLTVLYAESGVGKSSLLRAGVAARLRELAGNGRGPSRSPKFVPIVFSAWKDEPVDDLISEIRRQVHTLAPGSENGGPTTGLAAAVNAAASALDATLVIILDQFEEHFSYRLGRTRPGLLADELADCVNSPDVRANFLIAVREDTYGRLGDLFSGRISNVYNNYLHLEYLTRGAAREAIERPLEIYNAEHPAGEPVTLDPDLADAVLDEVRRGNLALGARRPDRDGSATWPAPNGDEVETPFLQLVLTRLWERERERGSRVLRTATLNGELGGAETIVRNHVGRALAGLGGPELETAIDMFGDLVTPSGVKVAHTTDDLAKMTGHAPEIVGAVLSRLYDERIVRAVDPAPATTQARYEIFHDRLAGPILDWRDRQENERLERARRAAEEEARLQGVQARRFKRRARIMLGLAVSMLVLLVAVIVLLQYARDQSDAANREKRAALRDTRLATYSGLTTRAQSQLSSRPDIAMLLYLAAYGAHPPAAAERNLVATLQGVTRTGAVGILHGHTEAVESLAFNPIGTTLASASGDKTIRLWTVTGAHGQVHHPLGAPLRAAAPLYSLAFASDGRTLASGSFDEIVLWSVPRHAQEAVIPYRSGAITSVAFSRRGNMLAAAGSNGTILLWNAGTHRTRLVRVHGTQQIRSVAFSPSGTVLAAAGPDNTVALYDVASGQPLTQLTGPTGVVYTVAFSPDGHTVAAAGSTARIVRWNLVDDSELSPVLVATSPINSLAFSPDGQTLASGGAITTTLWNLQTDSPLPVPAPTAQGAVYSVAFSHDGTVLASAGANRTITLWNPTPSEEHLGGPLISGRSPIRTVAVSPDGRLIAAGSQSGRITLADRRLHTTRSIPGGGGQVNDLAFDPTGRVLAAATADGEIRLWDVADRALIGAPLVGHVGAVVSLAFNSTGTELVSGGLDGTVWLWDLRHHPTTGRMLGSGLGAVYAVAVSHDGREVAAGGNGRAIWLWNAGTRRPLEPPLIPQADTVFALAFSPVGGLLASGGADDTIHLWDTATHPYVSVGALTGDSDYIRAIAFSPDGKTLASGSTDTTVRLWDVSAGTELGSPMMGHRQSVESVAFTPDGQLLASGSRDGTARLWPAVNLPPTSAALRDEICNFVGAGLNRAEWREYAPNIPYHSTCTVVAPS
jgi:WD40 repeat protein